MSALAGTCRPDLAVLAGLLKALLAGDVGVRSAVIESASALRRQFFGDWIAPMAPIEIANRCASDCLFCGWRVSNRAMKRLDVPRDLIMAQVEYLLDLGIPHVEFVSGDDIQAVRTLLPRLIRDTRAMMNSRGIEGKISFCTLALTENQYAELREAGADTMILWQETYDAAVFGRHIASGPKAYGINENWQVVPGGDGCGFRIESQERALRAGLEVALGSMLGLNPDVVTEFLATVEHARFLGDNYGASLERPIIVGLPIWNAITTSDTDMRPDRARQVDMDQFFPAVAGLYLLALPSPGTWVFPNCRVSMASQVEAARVAGCFTSTEVKLGPGGYLPQVVERLKASGGNWEQVLAQTRTLVREAGGELADLARALDEREQFVHSFHSHEAYVEAFKQSGLILAGGASIQMGNS